MKYAQGVALVLCESDGLKRIFEIVGQQSAQRCKTACRTVIFCYLVSLCIIHSKGGRACVECDVAVCVAYQCVRRAQLMLPGSQQPDHTIPYQYHKYHTNTVESSTEVNHVCCSRTCTPLHVCCAQFSSCSTHRISRISSHQLKTVHRCTASHTYRAR